MSLVSDAASGGKLERLSATEAAHRLAQRDITAEQLTRACLERIEARDPEIKAWTCLQADAAIERARQLDRGPIQGLLHGLGLGVKDLFDTNDLPATYGSPIHQGHRPASDAASVSLCRHAGAVILGKTVSTEFATFQPGPTRNPHNTVHTPGGSSSGSAAAVADFMVPLALGTQTAGSVVRPAAYCGIVGYKPSFGYIARAGVKSLSESLDTVGSLARSVDDAALLVAALSNNHMLLDLAWQGRARIGVYRGPSWHLADQDAQSALELACAKLSQAGASVSDAILPASCDLLVDLQQDIMAFEAFQALTHERLTAPDQISAPLHELFERGAAISFDRYWASLAAAAQARQAARSVFGDYDVLLTPGARGAAPEAASGTGDPVFCRGWTLLGLPCVQLPVMSVARGLPVGVQLVGAYGNDHAVLQIARWVEAQLQA